MPQSEGDGNPPPQSGRGDHDAFPTKEENGPPPMQRRICLSFNLKRKVEIYYEHKLYIWYVSMYAVGGGHLLHFDGRWPPLDFDITKNGGAACNNKGGGPPNNKG